MVRNDGLSQKVGSHGKWHMEGLSTQLEPPPTELGRGVAPNPAWAAST